MHSQHLDHRSPGLGCAENVPPGGDSYPLARLWLAVPLKGAADTDVRGVRSTTTHVPTQTSLPEHQGVVIQSRQAVTPSLAKAGHLTRDDPKATLDQPFSAIATPNSSTDPHRHDDGHHDDE